MLTNPPCKQDGEDCPARCIGCKSNCDEWKDWLAIHNAELEQIKKNKKADCEVIAFAVDRSKRDLNFSHIKSETKRRHGIR